MWKKRDIVRVSTVIIGTIVGWGLIRLLFPSLDYYPPESLINNLERSWFVTAGVRKLAMMCYGMVKLVVMAMLFSVVQKRWPGRGSFKGFAFGASLFDDLVGPASSLLFVPTNPLQIALLAGLGLWVGGMYLVLRTGLPGESTWARVAFFAFGVFGFSWTWFHLFLVIIDLAGLLHVGLLAGLMGAVGVFADALTYEWLFRALPRRTALDRIRTTYARKERVPNKKAIHLTARFASCR